MLAAWTTTAFLPTRNGWRAGVGARSAACTQIDGLIASDCCWEENTEPIKQSIIFHKNLLPNVLYVNQ